MSVPVVLDHPTAFSGVPDAQKSQGCKSKATTSTYVHKGKTKADEQSQKGTSNHQKEIWVPRKLIKAQEMWVPKHLCPAQKAIPSYDTTKVPNKRQKRTK